MKRILVIILICVLLGLIAKTVLSLWLLTRWPDERKGWSPQISLRGSELAGRTWPARPPAPWPEPNSWSESREFGIERLDARHSDAQTSQFSMSYVGSGWPMTTFYYRQCWWPWNDPQWATAEPTEIKCRPVPIGWVVNTAALGFAAWLLLFAAPATIRGYIAHIRRSRKLCPHCGYPTGTSPICTECGKLLSTVPPAGQSEV